MKKSQKLVSRYQTEISELKKGRGDDEDDEDDEDTPRKKKGKGAREKDKEESKEEDARSAALKQGGERIVLNHRMCELQLSSEFPGLDRKEADQKSVL